MLLLILAVSALIIYSFVSTSGTIELTTVQPSPQIFAPPLFAPPPPVVYAETPPVMTIPKIDFTVDYSALSSISPDFIAQMNETLKSIQPVVTSPEPVTTPLQPEPINSPVSTFSPITKKYQPLTEV